MASDDRPTPTGIQFKEHEGRRSSQRAAKEIFADAVRDADEATARSIERTKDWRKGYIEPVVDIARAGARSAKDALRIASDGLASVRRNLTFVRDGRDLALDEVISDPRSELETLEVRGEGQATTELEVPYRGEMLRGDALKRRIDGWLEAGTIEPSCADALRLVIDNPGWLDLSDRKFVLLGAASEMGPLIPLSSWRAHVIAVDLPRRHLWEHIVGTARRGSGVLSFPDTGRSDSSEVVERAGADLMTFTPCIRAWLDRFEGPLVLGNYVYADGANFVRLATAADVLVADIMRARPDCASAYLATPTDVYAVPDDIVRSVTRARNAGPRRAVLRTITGSRLYAPNYSTPAEGEGRSWGLSDSLVPIQGANYALAKAIQKWRALVAREEGRLSSANVAPVSGTRSVTKNRLLAAAYKGAPKYGVEIFEPPATRVLMAALLVHDLRNPQAAARPDASLDHPYDLFVQGALHGGIWRLPYEPRSVLPLALVRGLASPARR